MRPPIRPLSLLRAVLLAAACAAAAARPAPAQERVTATSGTPAAIARIRAAFAEIQRDTPAYRRTTHDVFEFSLEGGELTGYYDGGELRRLAARLFGESWRGTEDFYFADGELVFVHTVQERYKELLGGPVQWTIENRYYFHGRRLIRRVRTVRPTPGPRDDLSRYDPHVPDLVRKAKLFAACAAATGDDPPECTAPADVPQ